MASLAQPRPARPPSRTRPDLRAIARRRAARLHLYTYLAGNALFWATWAAVSVTADRWYWWATVPLAGWTLVLGAHLLHAFARRG